MDGLGRRHRRPRAMGREAVMPWGYRHAIVAVLALFAIASAGTVKAATLPFKPAAGQGLFLHVTDIHFDPFASLPADPAKRRAALHKLIATPVARWQNFFQAAKDTPFPRRGHADTSYPLFASMLAAAKGVTGGNGKRVHYDYVLNTGDNLAHGFRKKFLAAGGTEATYQGFVVKTLRFVDLMLRKRLGVPLIYAPGNNDAVCGDYKVAPHSAMLAQIARDLPVLRRHPEARRDFAVGGFYMVPHPTVPKHDIIALNSIFWSIKYKDDCNKTGGDPGGAELDWLAWTLYREKAAGRTATLAMHIPPGINGYTSSQQACPQTGTPFWRSDVTKRFRALVERYKGVLTASYAGHTHMDDLRVLPDASGAPLLATRITPAVSPIFGNNPGFAVILYDRKDAVVRDSAIVYLANLAQAGPKVPAQWRREYDFAKTYGITRYTAANVAALAKRIGANAGTAQSYMKFYPVEAPTPINEGNLKAYACAQTSPTPAAYAACRCRGK
jgi:sphingomyelin phosphodiesterase acid-like 3